MVGVDGSDPSKQALRWAVRQAKLTGAAVEACYVWHIPPTDGWAPMFDVGEDLAKAAEQVLADAVAEVIGEPPVVTVHRRVIEGNPAAVLLKASGDADLLVLGSRGHGGFVGALLGSTSQHCVHHAACPVVVIRGQQHR